MIEISDKHLCVGCGACSQICPSQCICMQEDEEGFLYPLVDKSKCIGCNLCERSCPVIHQNEDRIPLKVYAAYNKDATIRKNSSSGGVFYELAKQVILQGGVVFGAKFNNRWEVIHDYAETIEDLLPFMQSKYVQSYIGDSFSNVRHFLNSGRIVLFSGTPCQISGLLKFLNKEYENLITIDVLCHGVPSPGVWRWYLKEECESFNRKARKNSVSRSLFYSIPERDTVNSEDISCLKSISFRDKITGWKKFSFTLSYSEPEGQGGKNTISRSTVIRNNPYMKGFLNDWYLRYSCYQCPTRKFKSGSDITLADFWGYTGPDDDKGITALALNTYKGIKLVNNCSLHLESSSYEQICVNPAIRLHRIETWRRRDFFKSCKRTFFDRIKWLEKSTTQELAIHFVNSIYWKVKHVMGRALRFVRIID